MVGGLILEWYKMSGFLPSRKNVKSRLFDNWRFRPGLKMLASNRWRWVLCWLGISCVHHAAPGVELVAVGRTCAWISSEVIDGGYNSLFLFFLYFPWDLVGTWSFPLVDVEREETSRVGVLRWAGQFRVQTEMSVSSFFLYEIRLIRQVPLVSFEKSEQLSDLRQCCWSTSCCGGQFESGSDVAAVVYMAQMVDWILNIRTIDGT